MRLDDLAGQVAGDLAVRRHRGATPDPEAGAPPAADGENPEVTDVVHDTRRVRPGALFCCVPGQRVDGHDLAGEAVAAGAVALLVQRPLDVPVPQLVVDDVRRAMGPVAAAFWGHPSRDLAVVGVTGTSGKTTVTHLVQAVLEAAGRPCGVIGTLSGARTTPEGPELQALLAAERDGGRRAVAMEVSSHGLDQHRVDGTRFAVGVFTNLSQDHLDYHHTMEAYFAAKCRLFTPELCERAVVCVDDDWGRRLLDRLAGGPLEAHPYSVADAEDLDFGPGGAAFTWRGHKVDLALAGRFNVTNAVAAATAASLLGVPDGTIADGLSAARPVPGRFEPVDAGQPFTVLVDYSHKPDALRQAISSARELAEGGGRVTVVFGCGGDRDAAKRPLMGRVAAELADRVIVTSDNPRSEDPRAIIAAIRDGVPPGVPVATELDRRRAIAAALQEAGPGDVVLIAGKGHETTQVVGDQRLPFDDRVVARDVLASSW
ncbi:MAG TPA: UDP-N-acetylmuramoyl-L-alanyl-D-glutamate--2,6-diaminopimelate ligase [Acidimicrobiales bacterium]